MNTHVLGMLSLNIAFVLYLIVFVPQIWHNRDFESLKNLSPMMHLVLYFGVLFDLFYGFANDFQWQYKTVSIASLFVLSVQHVQLFRFFYQRMAWRELSINVVIALIMIGSICYFFLEMNHELAPILALAVGYASRVCYQLYAIPQIVKNIKLQDANAVSRYFLLINTTLLILDTISGWCLDWGWPAKLSPPISLVMMSVVLYQRKYFRVMKSLQAASV